MEEPIAKMPRISEESKEDSSSEQASFMKIYPLLHPSLLKEECPLADFRILRLTNKKHAGKFVTITPVFPEELKHLRRVYKQETESRVAIQLAELPIPEEILKVMTELDIDSSFLEIIKVPTKKPLTSKQADWARNYWPTAFHPNEEIEALLNDTYIEDRSYVETWSKKAREIGCILIQRGEILATGSSASKLLGHPVMEMIDHLALKDRNQEEYLATGCDVFLGAEPCAMCAMALVHARAARIFFTKKSTNGVLAEGSWQIQHISSFNHHYKAFYIDLGLEGEEQEVLCR